MGRCCMHAMQSFCAAVCFGQNCIWTGPRGRLDSACEICTISVTTMPTTVGCDELFIHLYVHAPYLQLADAAAIHRASVGGCGVRSGPSVEPARAGRLRGGRRALAAAEDQVPWLRCDSSPQGQTRCECLSLSPANHHSILPLRLRSRTPFQSTLKRID